jgi:transcriptional regulator with XRE-family HTH domain
MEEPSNNEFADKLNRLIDASGKSAPQIAAEIRAAGEGKASLSDSYFWQLRTGKKDPRLGVVRLIADYFGVHASYFLDDHGDPAEILPKLRATAGDEQVRGIATRAKGLKKGTLHRIAQIVEDARVLDGLDGLSDNHLGDLGKP